MMRKIGIYKIQSITKPERIYIGSSINLNARKNDHFSALRRGDASQKLQRHYNRFGKNDLQFIVLRYCSVKNLLQNEQYFIDLYKPWFNVSPTAGNCLGIKMSEESRIKISKSKKGVLVGSLNGFYGKHHTEETKEKIRLKKVGRKMSEEIKMKIGQAHSGQKRSIEARQNMSRAQRKIIHRLASEETKRKMSEAGLKAWKRRKLCV